MYSMLQSTAFYAQTLDNITKKYEILDLFNFAQEVDDLTSSSYRWCDTWKNHVFTPNQRLIVINVDVNYYFNQYGPSDDNWNFFRCCSYFNIPTEFIIYHSVSSGIHNEINMLCQQFNLTPPTIVKTFLPDYLAPCNNIPLCQFDISSATRPFICLNGRPRIHRLLLLSYLSAVDLMDLCYVTLAAGEWNHNYVSSVADIFRNMISSGVCPTNKGSFDKFHGVLSELTELTEVELSHLPSGFFRKIVPYTKNNDTFLVTKKDFDILDKHSKNFLDTTIQLSDYAELKNKNICIDYFWALGLENGIIYIITESVFEYPYPWVSEKTIKAILSKRPFIMVSSTGTIGYLNKMGFKTFNSLWDESYDNIINASDRMAAIVKLIADLSQEDLLKYQVQMKEIVEYNYNHYCNNYITNDGAEWFNGCL